MTKKLRSITRYHTIGFLLSIWQASKEIESFNIPNIIVKYHDTRAIS